MRIWLVITLILASALPAHAGPLAPALAALSAYASTTFAAITAKSIGAFLVKTVASMALSTLARAVTAKRGGKTRSPGIKTEATTSGGITSQKFVVGRSATAGHLIAPPNSQGDAGDTPRAWMVYPIALSVVAGCTVERVIIDDAYVEWQSTLGAWGVEAAESLTGNVWFDYEDGSQTAAHAGMLAVFGSDPDRPWLADMVGHGTCVTYLRFKYNRELFNGLPSVRFEVLGIPLYDPRRDSTVGGSGLQRWNDPSTWTQTENLIVISYNAMRGIDVGAGMIWGGECEAEDLPLSNWFAAMNACDLQVDDGNGGLVAQYRGGLEIGLDDEPVAVVLELLKACATSIAEVGGVWKVRTGGPALPSFFLTDDDLLISSDQEQTAFPGMSGTYNGITGTYPEPASLWESKEAPPRYNPAWEAEDGQLEYDEDLQEHVIRPRRLLAELDLPACPYVDQVQRIMAHSIADHRRMTIQKIVLSPEAMVLEPLDTVAWASEQYGYGGTGKVFEITSLTDSLANLNQGLVMRERDPADWGNVIRLPVTPSVIGTTPTPAQAVPGFGVLAIALQDAGGAARRPAIRISWDPDRALDARGVEWQIRRAASLGDAEMTGTHASISTAKTEISAGILPGTAYAVRARLIVDRATTWTGWVTVTTLDLRLSEEDMQTELRAALIILNDWISNGIPGIEGDISNLSELFRRLSSDVRAVAAEVIEGSAQRLRAEQQVRQYLATAEYTLGARVDATDDQVRVVSAAVTALQSVMPQLATTTALQALQTVVTQQGTTLSAVSQAVTVLQAELDGKASAEALSNLEATVTLQDGKITSQGTAITGLTSSLDATNGNVTTAQNAAQAASDLAGGKGKVMYQSAAPAVADRLAQNLWIDTTGGANTPKRWNGSAWVAVTDKVASDAAAAAANALTLAGTKADASALNTLSTQVTQQGQTISSQGTAITGLTSNLATTNTNVTTAQNAAQAASDLAGGKGKVMYQSAAPAVADRLAQNLWIDTTSGANTPKRWNGSAWVAVTDKVATDAAAAAANALAVANTKASASAVTALTTRVEQAELEIVAGANAQTALQAVVGMFQASGLFRVEVLATPSGALSRIGLKAAATNGETASARMAALFLEAIAGGGSRVVVQADTFAITDGEGRRFPFIVDATGVYLDVAFIKNLSVGTIKIADAAVTNFYATSYSGTHALNMGGERALLTLNFNAEAGERVILFATYRMVTWRRGTGTIPVTAIANLRLNGTAIASGSREKTITADSFENNSSAPIVEWVTTAVSRTVAATGALSFELRGDGTVTNGSSVSQAGLLELIAIRVKK